MPVTYTNRRGDTYCLCKSVTKTGKPRYYFAREQKGEPVEEVPAGYKIGESSTGLVYLEQDRPELILPAEVAVVEKALQRHPKGRNYRLKVKGDQITICERNGPDVENLPPFFQAFYRMGTADKVRASLEANARFSPVMRFTLINEEKRTFGAERWWYSGKGQWAHLSPTGPIDKLVRQLVPALGTDRFVELI